MSPDPAPLREPANVVVGLLLRAHEIAIERDNHPGGVELVARLNRLTQHLGSRQAMDVETDRFMLIPACLGHATAQHRLEALARRRIAPLEQKGQTLPLIGQKPLARFRQKVQRGFRRDRVAPARETLRAIRIVKVKNGRLGKAVRPAVAVRMQRVALDLDRTPVVRLHHQRDGTTACRHGRCKILGFAVHISLRLLGEGFQLELRTTAAGQTQARQREGGGHDLDEMPAGHRIRELAGAGRELAFQPLPELGRVSHLIQAPPVSAACFRLGTGGGNRLHRWQAEQCCRDSTFQSCTNFSPLARCSSAFCLGSVLHCQVRSVTLSAGRMKAAGFR